MASAPPTRPTRPLRTENRLPRDRGPSWFVIAGTLAGIVAVVALALFGMMAAGSWLWPAPPEQTALPAAEKVVKAGAATTPTAEAAATATLTASQPLPKQEPVAVVPKAAPKAAAPKAKSNALPDHMKALPSGSTQLIVITGRKVGSTAGTLAVFNRDGGIWRQVLSTDAHFGANGLIDGDERRQGSKTTPTGIWKIGSFAFGQHSSAPSGTRIPYRAITSDSWWSSEQDSTYNTWVESSSHVNGEHLQDARVQYEWAFDTGYNAPPNKVVMGRGTAIFIHCDEPPGNALGPNTHGCIAIPAGTMVKLLQTLAPSRKPYCAIGTWDAGTTQIYNY